jgi:hypothetical protein
MGNLNPERSDPAIIAVLDKTSPMEVAYEALLFCTNVRR